MDTGTLRGNLTALFWGAALVFLDVGINQFDVLHDALGYAVVVAALSGARTALDDDAFRARALVAILAALVAAGVEVVADLAPGTGSAWPLAWAGLVAPALLAFALLRAATVLNAQQAARTWGIVLALFGVAAVLIATAVASERDTAGVVGAVVGVSALAAFLAAVWQTRGAVPARHERVG